MDYQWPSYDFKSAEKVKSCNYKSGINHIEQFFSEKLDCYCVLTPSARSAISMYIRLKGLNRNACVQIPQWSSKCLYDAVTPYATPVLKNKNSELDIAVHKWGRLYKSKHASLIEDSVDSLILDSKSMFFNKGEIGVFSMPKLIGSLSGGILSTKNTNIYSYFKSIQTENKAYGEKVADLRFNKKSLLYWGDLEYINSYVDKRIVVDVLSNLENYEFNISRTQRNLELYVHLLKFNLDTVVSSGRLWPVLLLPSSQFKTGVEKNLMMRNFSTKYNTDNLFFEKMALIPVHFQMGDEKVKEFSKIIKKFSNTTRLKVF